MPGNTSTPGVAWVGADGNASATIGAAAAANMRNQRRRTLASDLHVSRLLSVPLSCGLVDRATKSATLCQLWDTRSAAAYAMVIGAGRCDVTHLLVKQWWPGPFDRGHLNAALRNRQHLAGIDQVRVGDAAGVRDHLVSAAVAVEAFGDGPQGVTGDDCVGPRGGRWWGRWRCCRGRRFGRRGRWLFGGDGNRVSCRLRRLGCRRRWWRLVGLCV